MLSTTAPRAGHARILAALTLAALLAAPAIAGGDLEIHFINVDQGKAILVKGPGGTNVLVDGGNPGDGSGIVRPYLLAHGVSTLHYSIATHWHTDHMGGLDEVFNLGLKPTTAAFDRGDFMRPSNSQVNAYLSSVASPPGLRQTPAPAQVIALGGGATLEITSVNGNYIGGFVDPNSGSDFENSSSISCVVRYGDFDCWLTGDINGGGSGTANVETPAAGAVGRVEVVDAAHHGSFSSSATGSVSILAPSLVVYSCGEDNPYGHPHDTVTDRWNSSSQSRVQWCTTLGDTTNGNGGYFTASGHIVITSDGNTFQATRSSGSETLRFTTFEQLGMRAGVGQVVTSEILVNPAGAADTVGEWWEVLNRSTYTLNLGGMRFQVGANQFTLGSQILIDPGQRLVVGLDGRMSRNGQVFVALSAPWGGFALPDGGGTMILTSQAGLTMESVTWGGGGIPVTSGVSAEREDIFGGSQASNFSPATTSWAGGDLGTPGGINSAEPFFCPIPISYCVGAPNSVGAGARMGYTGSTDTIANNLTLTSTGRPNGSIGIFFHAGATGQVPFGNGFLCTSGAVVRLGVAIANSSGIASRAVNVANQPLIVPGATRYFQDWYRNPAGGGAGFNLSDGLAIEFCAFASEGAVLITEFQSDPTFVSDANGEWIELYNATAGSIDLANWVLSTNNGADVHVITGSLPVPSGGFVVLGPDANPLTNGGVTVSYQYSGLTIADGGDEIRLLLPDATTQIDAVNSSIPFFPVTAGRSSTLKPGSFNYLANDASSAWCLSQTPIGGSTDFGTPGSPNETCP